MKRLVPALVVGFVCLSSACSEEEAAGWLGALEGVTVGRADDEVSSPAAIRRALEGGAPKSERPALDPAKLLRVTTGPDGMEIATRGRVFQVRSRSGVGRPIWRPVDGEGTDGPWVTARIEESVAPRARAEPHRERFEVTVPDDIVTLRDAGDYLEFFDTENVPVLRMHHHGRATIWGAVPAGARGGLPAFALRGESLEVELSAGLEGLAGQLAVTPGWSSTSAMSQVRQYFTPTLLPDGKVLAAGGGDGQAATASAELYDPATGAWQATAPMHVARHVYAASLLQNGQVLIAGGTTTAAELYDPVAGTWRETGSMAHPCYYSPATLLRSGNVLVVEGPYFSESELYDPTTETCSLTTPMVYAPYKSAIVQLPSGEVLAVGDLGYAQYAQIYDPLNDEWRSASSPPSSVTVMTLLGTGKVLSTYTGSGPWLSALYDPVSGTWSPTGASQFGGSSLALLPSGEVLKPDTGELYDPAAGTWRPTSPPQNPHSLGSAMLLPSGKLMAFGGNSVIPEVFDPGAGTWTGTASQATARSGASVTQLPDGKALIAGGQGDSGPAATAELYDPATDSWLTTGSMHSARAGHTATLLPNGVVLVAGGSGPSGPLNDAELYDPVSRTWSLTGPLAAARSGHTATLLPGGSVLVVGGSNSGDSSGALASAELYDPRFGTWTTTARPMNARRTGHTATLLSTGAVLVAGGQASSGPMKSTELYDPGLDAWSPGTSLVKVRAGHTATLLSSGRVLIAGGQGATGPLASTELYLPANGTFRTGGAMAAARSGHTATMLAGGKVLVAGGVGAAGLLADAEGYDEASDAWRPAGALATARTGAAALLLVSERVLVAGGSTTSGISASAELYEDTGASDAWRPSFAAIPALGAGMVVTVNGSRFRGVSEATNGNYWSPSVSNVPVVRLLPLGGGALTVPWQRFSDTSLTFTAPSAPEGYYRLSVLTNGIPGSAVVFIDGPPPAPILTSPGPLVATSRPLVAGTSEIGSTVTVSFDGSALGTASVDGSGNWSLTPSSALVDGPHSVTARTTDARGVQGPWSPPLSFTVDTVAPASPSFTGPGPWTGTQPTLSGTAEPGSLVRVWVDGAIAGTPPAIASGQWTLAVASPLAQGPHAATAQAQDAAGNTSPISAARSFTVDTVPPPPPVILSPGDGALITSRTPGASGTAERGSTVTVTVDGTASQVMVADASGAWSCPPFLVLGEGVHSITAQATDAAGNGSQATGPRPFTIDSIAPAPPVVLTPLADSIEGSALPMISGTAEVGVQVTLWLDGAQAGTVGTVSNGTWSSFPPAPLDDGPHTIAARATDAAGNDSAFTSAQPFTVQAPRPAAPQILGPDRPVNTPNPVITGQAGSEDTVEVMLDGALAGTTQPDQAGSWSFTPPAPLADGAHTAAAQAKDRQFRTSLMSTLITFQVDTVAPPAPSLEAPGRDALVRDPRPRFLGTAEPGSIVTVMLNGARAGVARSEMGTWTFQPPAQLPEGLHVVTLQAADAAGNVSPGSSPLSFTVQRTKSFSGSGCSCSAAPSGSQGALWLLLLGAARCAGARTRRSRASGLARSR